MQKRTKNIRAVKPVAGAKVKPKKAVKKIVSPKPKSKKSNTKKDTSIKTNSLTPATTLYARNRSTTVRGQATRSGTKKTPANSEVAPVKVSGKVRAIGSKNQHVIPLGNGWMVKGAGSKIITVIADSKKQAVDIATSIAKSHGSELYIHNKTGAITESRSYVVKTQRKKKK